MISIITASRESDLSHKNYMIKTIGIPYEYIRITGAKSICQAYNKGVHIAKGDILVFIHEDAYFVDREWGKKLINIFSDPTVGLVGVSGIQYLDNDDWSSAGRPFLQGKIITHSSLLSLLPFWKGRSLPNDYILIVYSDELQSDVVAVDGLFMAIRAGLFKTISFDEQFNWHMYDLDICMQVLKTHRVVVSNFNMVHYSVTFNSPKIDKEGRIFCEKYKNILPSSVRGINLSQPKIDPNKQLLYPLSKSLNLNVNDVQNRGYDVNRLKLLLESVVSQWDSRMINDISTFWLSENMIKKRFPIS